MRNKETFHQNSLPPGPAESEHFVKDEFGDWVVTLDNGASILSLPQQLGHNLASIFAAQEGKKGPLANLKGKWELLNCRKTVALAKGVIAPDDLGSMQGSSAEKIMEASGFRSMDAFLDFEQEGALSDLGLDSIEQVHDTDGIFDLMRTVRSLQNDPNAEITIEADGGERLAGHIEELEQENPGIFPLEVHIFHPLPTASEQIAEKVARGERLKMDDFFRRMHRNHSFIVLGRDSAGRMLCVHKGSAAKYDEVGLVELADVVRWGFSIEREGAHLVAFGPVQMQTEPTADSS